MKVWLRFAGLALFVLAVVGLAHTASAKSFPDIIPLPDGFGAEGIAIGRGHTAYAGSLANGGIFTVDLRSGAGKYLVPPQTDGRIAVGLSVDERSNLLYVAGGTGGNGYVYDAATGAEIAVHDFSGGFVNDVIVTREAAYFTDSFAPFIYKVPIGPGGAASSPGSATAIFVGGDFVQGSGFNLNGIEASANGRYLFVVQSGPGNLFRVDPNTGEAKLIDLGGASVMFGDGLFRQGNTLYVVRNFLNQVDVIQLSGNGTSGTVTGSITDSDFAIPTTAAGFGSSLYLVNARFGLPPGPFQIVKVAR